MGLRSYQSGDAKSIDQTFRWERSRVVVSWCRLIVIVQRPANGNRSVVL